MVYRTLRWQAVIEEVRAAIEDWSRFADEAGVTKASKAEISMALEVVAVRFSA